MSITRWDPFLALSHFTRWDEEFANLIDRNWRTGPRPHTYSPATTLTRDGTDVVLTFEVPGMNPETDLSVEVTGSHLVIAGAHTHAAGTEQSRVTRRGAFRRTFTLPDGIEAEQVHAAYEHGILTVRISGAVPPEPTPTRIAITHDSARELTAADTSK